MADLNIEQLCDYVIAEIFSNLRVKDLTRSVQHVCRRWREIYFSPMLWKKIQYRPEYEDDAEEVLDILKQTPQLKCVNFDRTLANTKMIETLANNGRVVKLELGEFKAFTRELLRKLQQNCPLLELLTVQETLFHDIKMGEIIADFQNLKSLIVLQDPNIPESPIKMKPVADGCPKLEYLEIGSPLPTKEDLEYLLVKKKDKLKYLGIVCWTVDGHCTLPLISRCTKLNKLNIGYVCRWLVEELCFPTGLTSFSWKHLGTTNLTYIVEIFSSKSLCQLTELNISRYTSYEDILLNTIVQYCPFLNILHLSECWNLTDESLKNLHVLRHLRSVDFSGSKVTDYGITFLVMCEQLQYVNLSCCRHLTGGILLSMARLRYLRILILDGCYLRGIPAEVMKTSYPGLVRLSLQCCYGITKTDMDHLTFLMSEVELG